MQKITPIIKISKRKENQVIEILNFNSNYFEMRALD